mgnify:CR=1 FL=1|jgi:ribosomal protein S21
MAKVVNVEVTLNEVRGDTNRLIRKFIKKVKKEGILENYRERMYYEKPSSKKRRKKLRSKELARREQEKKKLELEKRK